MHFQRGGQEKACDLEIISQLALQLSGGVVGLVEKNCFSASLGFVFEWFINAYQMMYQM